MPKKSIEELLMSGKIKRFFRSDKNIIIENGIYHVIQRAPGTEQLFIEDSDYLYFLSLLKKIVPDYKLRLFSFALLPNHLHILLQIKERNLSRAMQSIFCNYAMFFNRKYQRKGHVFGGKYRPILCNSEIYLMVISAYIHLNPLKANLCKCIRDYRWTSIMPYFKEMRKDTFIDYEYILRMFSPDISKARKEYEDFLFRCRKTPYSSIVENPDAPDVFLTKVFKFIREKIKKVDSISKGDFCSFEDQLDLVADRKRLLRPEHKKARRYLIDQLRSRGYDIAAIAGILKLTRATVYSYLR